MVQERNSSAYRSSAPKRGYVPAKPKFASQGDIEARQSDAGGRTAFYQLTGRDGTARTNDVRWGGGGGDPLADLFMATPPTSGGGGGGGGRSHGGGGGGVSAATQNAYKALLAQSGAGWDAYDSRISNAYAPSKINQIYDTQAAGVSGAADAGRGRLAPIMQELQDRASTARTGVNQAYGDADARLQALQQEYMAQSGAAGAGLNNVLSKFGAGTVEDTGAQSLLNMFANSRVANTRSQGVMDAGLADRPAVYEGLNADVQSGISRDQTGLENRIAQQRAASQMQNDQTLAQLLATSGLQRLQQQQEIEMQLASMGIDPSTVARK